MISDSDVEPCLTLRDCICIAKRLDMVRLEIFVLHTFSYFSVKVKESGDTYRRISLL